MVAKEADTGKAYLHAHKDVNAQPVIVIRSSHHITGRKLSALIAVVQKLPAFQKSGATSCLALHGNAKPHVNSARAQSAHVPACA